jgi:hypothetical protein
MAADLVLSLALTGTLQIILEPGRQGAASHKHMHQHMPCDDGCAASG